MGKYNQDDLNKYYKINFDSSKNKIKEKYFPGSYSSYSSTTIEEIQDTIHEINRDTATLGTLKVRDGKLIVEHSMKETVLCDLEDENAAATIMGAIAKIQLEETISG